MVNKTSIWKCIYMAVAFPALSSGARLTGVLLREPQFVFVRPVTSFRVRNCTKCTGLRKTSLLITTSQPAFFLIISILHSIGIFK